MHTAFARFLVLASVLAGPVAPSPAQQVGSSFGSEIQASVRALRALHAQPQALQYAALLLQHLQGQAYQMGLVGVYTAPASD